jgi:predicted short-subunit dehydrogenase-like oxidoreductase (DUF2520 family)
MGRDSRTNRGFVGCGGALSYVRTVTTGSGAIRAADRVVVAVGVAKMSNTDSLQVLAETVSLPDPDPAVAGPRERHVPQRVVHGVRATQNWARHRW